MTGSSLAVLREGWQLFLAGLPRIFPWILAAELIPLLPFANPPGGLFTTDLSLFADPGYLVRALLLGALQAFLYSLAVLKLAALDGVETAARPAPFALRSVPTLLVAYLGYELVVGVGLVLTFVIFLLGFFIFGPLGGVVLCVLPLGPTAAASTALALFIYPAVLERRGPFAALGESSRLARTSWVRVSLVISVPAVALLLTSVLADIPTLNHGLTDMLGQMDNVQESASLDQLDSLLAGFKPQVSDRYSAWQVASLVLGALAWWYTLAVCYAQYRDLKVGEKA